ncbi:hypothetical protein DE146DRAFT_745424 [Phaeosphaeria sp. MPI-PUGE-AT-0046c]|nr:hypothetical protein DE146DRAFT_745424 [Phaeosphaeria sp. MPI-PUGE-AT-0046c]
MADCNETQSTTPPAFLSVLPLELRSYIYSHLLVSSQPIKGPLSRSHNSEKYSIHTAILRTCKQINTEARQIFFGKNTFCISSVPPEEDVETLIEEQDQPTGAFEPPLQISDLHLIRHLEIDLLYYPSHQPQFAHCKAQPQPQPHPTGADRYITNLSHLLTLTKPSLSSLALTFDTRPHLASPSSSPDQPALNLPFYLTGPSSADTSARFRSALEALAIPEMALRFDFPEARFDFHRVKREVLVASCLVSIVGQVLMARSELGIRGVLEALGDEQAEDAEGVRG